VATKPTKFGVFQRYPLLEVHLRIEFNAIISYTKISLTALCTSVYFSSETISKATFLLQILLSEEKEIF